ncbi:hypothetical protein BS17DRAFT_765811 [Gyrodon lividus]|nr:hypothetical protein BS17DRAFT_765811 [Gyrodon lividus]
MPNIFNILLLELTLGAETFHMTFEPQFPDLLIRPTVVEVPIVRPQNVPATNQQDTVLQQVHVGSSSHAIVAMYPVPENIWVIDPNDPSATESESALSTPQIFFRLLKSVSLVQDPNNLSTTKSFQSQSDAPLEQWCCYGMPSDYYAGVDEENNWIDLETLALMHDFQDVSYVEGFNSILRVGDRVVVSLVEASPFN